MAFSGQKPQKASLKQTQSHEGVTDPWRSKLNH
jgi:hypothetical protein